MEKIASFIFIGLLVVATFFYVYFAIKKQHSKRDLLEVGVWGVIFVAGVGGFNVGINWSWYVYSAVALTFLVTKLILLVAKKN